MTSSSSLAGVTCKEAEEEAGRGGAAVYHWEAGSTINFWDERFARLAVVVLERCVASWT